MFIPNKVTKFDEDHGIHGIELVHQSGGGKSRRPMVQTTRPISIRVNIFGVEHTFTIVKNFRSDLASTPRIMWAILPPWGSYSVPAILHDFLWRISNKTWIPGLADTAREEATLDPVYVDEAFKSAMRDEGTSFPVRWAMWAAVRSNAIFGGRVGEMTAKLWAQLVATWAGVIVAAASLVLIVRALLALTH